jgi:hypothetical protein
MAFINRKKRAELLARIFVELEDEYHIDYNLLLTRHTCLVLKSLMTF